MAETIAIWLITTFGAVDAAGVVVVSMATLDAVTAIVSFVAIAGANMAANKLLAPKMPSYNDPSLTTRSQMVRSPIAARQIIYGRSKVSGVVVYISVTGTKNEYLHLVVALAGHQVEEIGDVYFNDELALTGSGSAAQGRFSGYADIYKKLGSDTQTVQTDLETATAGLTNGKWTSNHRLRGIAYVYVRLKWDSQIWQGGIPSISAIVKGKQVYDPRTATTVYSANAALCLRDYLTSSSYGLAMSSSEVDDTAFSVAANICDEQVEIKPVTIPPTYENRYEVNGVLYTSSTPDDNIGKLLGAMGGLMAYSGGKIVPYAAGYRIPTVTLTESDFVGAINVQTKTSARDRVNAVKGVYVAEENQWQPSDFPPSVSATYYSQDNNVRYWRDVVLPFTTSSSCAQRLARIELRRARQEITLSSNFRLDAMQLRAGDTVMVTLDRFGWSSKVFEVMDWSFVSEGNPPQLQIQMTLRETASSVYDWSVTDEESVVDAPTTTLPNPFSITAPKNLALTADGTTQLIQADGTALPRIKVAWSAPSDDFVQSGGDIIVEYKQGNSTTYLTWSRLDGDQTLDYISSDVRIGTTYDVRIYGMSFFGITSNAITASVTVVKDTTAPADPTNLVVTAGNGLALSLDWDDNTEPDFSEYGIYRNTTGVTPASATADQIAQTRSSWFVDTQVTIGTTYYYWVNAYDFLENVSGFSNRGSGVALSVTGSGVVTTPPSTPSALVYSSSSVYIASDGTSTARISFAVPAMPTLGVILNVLFRKTGASQWMIASSLDAGGGYISVDDLSCGTVYDFAVQAFSYYNIGSAISTVTTRTAPQQPNPPATPTGLTATIGTGKAINLYWDQVTDLDFDEYKVYRNTTNNSSTASLIADAASNRFVDINVSLATAYWYWVSAVNRSNVESAKSASATATSIAVPSTEVDATAPVTPSAPTVSSTGTRTATDGTVFSYVVLNLPSLPSGSVGFNVLYRKNGAAGWMIGNQAFAGSTTSSVDDLTSGTSYDFAIQAFSFSGISSAISSVLTQTAPAKSTAPSTPTGLVITAANGIALSLDWDDNTESDFSEYGVYRNLTGITPVSATYDQIAQTRSSRFVDTQVAVGTTYYYWVNAYNTSENVSGFSSRSSGTPISVTGTLYTTAPSTPGALTFSSSSVYLAADGTTTAQIAFSVPAMPSLGVILNILYRKSGGSQWMVAAQLTSGGGYVTVDDLSCGTVYDFAVQAFSYYNVGSTISSVNTQTAPPQPNAPATPSGAQLSSDGVRAKYFPGTQVFLFGTRVGWIANTANTDFAYYEVKATQTDSDAATDYSWTPYDGANYVIRTTENQTWLYNATNGAGYVRLRAVNRSGVASAWVRIANANGYSSIGSGSISQYNDNNVTTTGIKTGGGSSTRQINVRYETSAVFTLTGGATSETLTLSISNAGFSAKPDSGQVQVLDVDYAAFYDYDNVSNSSTTVYIKFSRFDGGTLGSGNIRTNILLIDYT